MRGSFRGAGEKRPSSSFGGGRGGGGDRGAPRPRTEGEMRDRRDQGSFSSRGGARGRGSFGGGRGSFDGGRGFSGGRGSFDGGRGSFGRGRGSFDGGRGSFGGGRGSFDGGRGFSGGRGSFDGGRGSFGRGRGSFDGGRGSFGGGRGSFSGGRGGSNPNSGGYRPKVSEMGSRSEAAKSGRSVVVILEKAGLLLGNRGIVDAYERAPTTEIANESLKDVRPDIVHQCLLALFDSDLAYNHQLRVYVSLFARTGKVIEVSPTLRPPRTYARFRGLMAALLRDGRVTSVDGQVLMRLLPGSVAPIIPHGAEVTGICNDLNAPVITPSGLAKVAQEQPVPDSLQGGVKGVDAFYVVSCTDDSNLDGIDYVTKPVCISAYPTTAHVTCARICEAHTRSM